MAQRTQPSSPARRDDSQPEVIDDADPTYSHFGHRNEFLRLLNEFVATDVQTTPSTAENDAEDELVKKMGAIVSYHWSDCADISSTSICPCPGYWIQRWATSYLHSWQSSASN